MGKLLTIQSSVATGSAVPGGGAGVVSGVVLHPLPLFNDTLSK